METRIQTVYYNVTLRRVRATIVAEEKRLYVSVSSMQCACTTLSSMSCPTLPHSSSLSHKLQDIRKSTTGQQISKTFCICDENVINLFVCIYEVRKGTYKQLLGSSFIIMLPLWYIMKCVEILYGTVD